MVLEQYRSSMLTCALTKVFALEGWAIICALTIRQPPALDIVGRLNASYQRTNAYFFLLPPNRQSIKRISLATQALSRSVSTPPWLTKTKPCLSLPRNMFVARRWVVFLKWPGRWKNIDVKNRTCGCGYHKSIDEVVTLKWCLCDIYEVSGQYQLTFSSSGDGSLSIGTSCWYPPSWTQRARLRYGIATWYRPHLELASSSLLNKDQPTGAAKANGIECQCDIIGISLRYSENINSPGNS